MDKEKGPAIGHVDYYQNQYDTKYVCWNIKQSYLEGTSRVYCFFILSLLKLSGHP